MNKYEQNSTFIKFRINVCFKLKLCERGKNIILERLKIVVSAISKSCIKSGRNVSDQYRRYKIINPELTWQKYTVFRRKF
jgi:hypothetical protein